MKEQPTIHYSLEEIRESARILQGMLRGTINPKEFDIKALVDSIDYDLDNIADQVKNIVSCTFASVDAMSKIIGAKEHE